MYRSEYELPNEAPHWRTTAERARSDGRTVHTAFKRAVDIACASVFFLAFGWLFVGCWLGAIITQGSPAIYKHRRVGRNGVEFDCLKFRSMALNGDQILAEHLAACPQARAEWDRDFKLRDDPRVTKFGQFLRQTSLDELPQFWNVLKGDMSMVGPRPVVAKELALYYGDAAAEYVRVRPGLTGPWQISGRHVHSYEHRVALDCAYVRNWTVASDLLIMFRTAMVVVGRKGAF